MESDLLDEDHETFRGSVRGFVNRHVVPNLARWDAQRLIDREVWIAAGEQGLLGLAVPEQYGGAGESDYRYRYVVQSEIARVGAAALQSGFSTNDDIVLNYLLRHADAQQRDRWLRGFATGETIGAIAMTEPDAGSDLRAVRTTAQLDRGSWVLNGQKTFITSGILADLVIVFARTDGAEEYRGFSLFVVRRARPASTGVASWTRSAYTHRTRQLFFEEARIPAANLLGNAGSGFGYLMQSLPLERLGIAIAAQTSAEAAFEWTLTYVKERRAFGRPIGSFQALGFSLADLQTAIEVTRTYIDRCIREYNAGTLTAIDAAKAKMWATDLQGRVIDTCVQLHGGYGYMMEYPIAKAFSDARVQRIYGGTNEIMREFIHRDLIKT